MSGHVPRLSPLFWMVLNEVPKGKKKARHLWGSQNGLKHTTKNWSWLSQRNTPEKKQCVCRCENLSEATCRPKEHRKVMTDLVQMRSPSQPLNPTCPPIMFKEGANTFSLLGSWHIDLCNPAVSADLMFSLPIQPCGHANSCPGRVRVGGVRVRVCVCMCQGA